MTSPRVSALIVSYNTRELLLEAVASVIREPDVEVIVFDNASSDGSGEAVQRAFDNVEVIESPANLGFAAGNNEAASHASGRMLLFLNPDAALRPGALDALVETLDRQPRAA